MDLKLANKHPKYHTYFLQIIASFLEGKIKKSSKLLKTSCHAIKMHLIKKINYDKSEISFSPNLSSDYCILLKSCISIRQVNKHAKYLGLLSAITRS